MPTEDRRRALVEAAYDQIAERGFEGLRTRDVAARVGVNIATLHYYFPTKEALISGVLDLAMQRFRSTLTPHGSSAEVTGSPGTPKFEPSESTRNGLRVVTTNIECRRCTPARDRPRVCW